MNPCVWIDGERMCGAPAKILLCEKHRAVAAARAEDSRQEDAEQARGEYRNEMRRLGDHA